MLRNQPPSALSRLQSLQPEFIDTLVDAVIPSGLDFVSHAMALQTAIGQLQLPVRPGDAFSICALSVSLTLKASPSQDAPPAFDEEQKAEFRLARSESLAHELKLKKVALTHQQEKVSRPLS